VAENVFFREAKRRNGCVKADRDDVSLDCAIYQPFYGLYVPTAYGTNVIGRR